MTQKGGDTMDGQVDPKLPTRQKEVLEILRREPGLRIHEIVARLSPPVPKYYVATRQQLEVLLQKGLVRRDPPIPRRGGTKVYWYPADTELKGDSNGNHSS